MIDSPFRVIGKRDCVSLTCRYSPRTAISVVPIYMVSEQAAHMIVEDAPICGANRSTFDSTTGVNHCSDIVLAVSGRCVPVQSSFTVA